MKSKQDNPKIIQFDSGVWSVVEQLGTSFLEDVAKDIVKTYNFSRDYSIKLAKRSGAFLDPEPDGHTEINIISILDSENTWNIRIVHKNKEKYDIFIGRPSKWGNPFVIGKDGTREQVIAKYRKWILTQPKLIRDLSQLNGKTLGCWCSPKPCHGNVLKELAEKSLQ